MNFEVSKLGSCTWMWLTPARLLHHSVAAEEKGKDPLKYSSACCSKLLKAGAGTQQPSYACLLCKILMQSERITSFLAIVYAKDKCHSALAELFTYAKQDQG